MTSERRTDPSSWLTKKWDPVFFTRRMPNENATKVQQGKRLGASGDDLCIFLQDSNNSIPSFKVEEIREFCERASSVDLDAGTASQKRNAWLDDRSSNQSRNGCRDYSQLVTATDFHRYLKGHPFSNRDTPDMERRLIYIQNLDPEWILALAATATYHQTVALREAIWKHITRQTSISVKVPNTGYSNFCLEFHLPFFALRTVCQVSPDARTLRKWTDLSFLDIRTSPTSKPSSQYGIYRSQVSVILCGSDNRRWIGYCFVDTDSEDDDEYNLSGEVKADPILERTSVEIDANYPIWDPREYFLQKLMTRTVQVVSELEYLVRKVERSIQTQQDLGATPGAVENCKASLDRIVQTKKLLSELLSYLESMLRSWDDFSSSNGDICYFSDITNISTHIRNTLSSTQKNFEDLKALRDTLLTLENTCNNSARVFELQLMLQSNIAAQHSSVTTEFIVFALSPFFLAAVYFSMPQEVIPIQHTFKYFVTAQIVIIIAVWLVFVVFSTSSRWPCWWTKISSKFKSIEFNYRFCGQHDSRPFSDFTDEKGFNQPRGCENGLGVWKTENSPGATSSLNLNSPQLEQNIMDAAKATPTKGDANEKDTEIYLPFSSSQRGLEVLTSQTDARRQGESDTSRHTHPREDENDTSHHTAPSDILDSGDEMSDTESTVTISDASSSTESLSHFANDSLWIGTSNAAGQDAALSYFQDSLKKEMVDRLMLRMQALLRQESGFTQTSPGEEVQRSNNAVRKSSASSRNNQLSFRRQGRNSGKNKDQPEESSDEDNEEGGKAPNSQIKVANSVGRRLACPYYQRNPLNHKKWRSCAGPGWETVHRMKAHIYRRHALPKQCPRCCAEFNSDLEFDGHLQQVNACEKKTIVAAEGLSKSQEKILRTRQRSAAKREPEKWIEVYKILFPGDDQNRIPSPYYAAESTDQTRLRNEEIALYEAYSRRELPSIVRKRLELRASAIEEQLGLEFLDIVRESQMELSRAYQQNRLFQQPEIDRQRNTHLASTPLVAPEELSAEQSQRIDKSTSLVPPPLTEFDMNGLAGYSLPLPPYTNSNGYSTTGSVRMSDPPQAPAFGVENQAPGLDTYCPNYMADGYEPAALGSGLVPDENWLFHFQPQEHPDSVEERPNLGNRTDMC